MEQGSPEWLEIRRGKMTASHLSDVMAKTKTGWGATRKNYLSRLVCERLTGKVVETFKSAAMERGNIVEAEARTAYEFYINDDVAQVAFVDHPKIEMCGASPDGYVGVAGLVEIKCPESTKHIKNLEGGNIDGTYLKQMQWQMACTNRQWVDYVSYNPNFPEEMKLLVQRVQRDDEMIKEVETIVQEFLDEVATTVDSLNVKYITN